MNHDSNKTKYTHVFAIEVSAMRNWCLALIFIATASMANAEEVGDEPTQANPETSSLSAFLEEEELELNGESARIRFRDFESWEKIDDYNIMVISKHPNKKYLMSFKTPCQQLDDDAGITFRSTSSYISKLDSVFVAKRTDLTDIDPTGVPTRLLQTCTIENIVELKMPKNAGDTQ